MGIKVKNRDEFRGSDVVAVWKLMENRLNKTTKTSEKRIKVSREITFLRLTQNLQNDNTPYGLLFYWLNVTTE